MNKIREFVKKHIYVSSLFFYSVFILFVNLRINIFRYNNFDYGKFDLGNMSQMLWNTLNGRFMYLTDYFGTNLPRWSMSHVDPILLLFLPVFAIFQSPFTLIVVQLLLVIFSSLLVYLIAKLVLKSEFLGLIFGLIYLGYPALGFLTAWTGYHGVSVAIPFFLAAFYVLEKMYCSNNFTKNNLVLFWALLLIFMTGKEQLSLYVFMWGVSLVLFRSSFNIFDLPKLFNGQRLQAVLSDIRLKNALTMIMIGLIWFIMAFFVIIPSYAHYRIEGFNKFALSLDLDPEGVTDVTKSNYFLKRYESFGDGYLGVLIGILSNPDETIRVFFGGDKLDNFAKTLGPVFYLPFLAPQVFMIALPDFAINYLTTLDGVGTSEIYNHRISMIIPVVIVSLIYSIRILMRLVYTTRLQASLNKYRLSPRIFLAILGLVLLFSNIKASFSFENPVYLWFSQAIQKKLLGSLALAKTDTSVVNRDMKIGDVVRLTTLENKDRECATDIIKIIPPDASVSGPDYMGAHLSLRETYAIFPALYNEADYVIIDVFSKKILTILDADVSLVKDVVKDMITNPEYEMLLGCGNLFVFKKNPSAEDTLLLPLQERFSHPEKVNLEIFQSLTVVDYSLPQQFIKGKSETMKIVYSKKGDPNLADYVLYTTFVNNNTGEVYQFANLPSFAINPVREWVEGYYYIEDFSVSMPEFVPSGNYKAFVGMTNNIRSRSLYLGDVMVK